MSEAIEGVLVIGLGFFLGLLLYKKLVTPVSTTQPVIQVVKEVVYKSGDPVADFLDNYGT